MQQLEKIINEAFDNRADFDSKTVSTDIRDAVEQSLALLDSGEGRVAEKKDGDWIVNQWLKKAVLLSFKINDNRVMDGDENRYYDKVETKFANYSEEDFKAGGMRAVPGSVVRAGSYIGSNVVLMPSFVNIGAYVDNGSMVDGWATVGSCAQIGKNVHLSGGVGIGGVL
ncbi:MAG: 2,3,4,5-tetrahydropyridine-2,6-dicarboxylate N-succinyltransferase, partial [Cycloclasticus sp.]